MMLFFIQYIPVEIKKKLHDNFTFHAALFIKLKSYVTEQI